MRSSRIASLRRNARLAWLATAGGIAALVLAGAGAGAGPGDIAPIAGQPRSDCLDVNVPAAQPGSATTARFNYTLRGISVDADGDRLFVAESRTKPGRQGGVENDSRIWGVTLGTDRLVSVAGGGEQAVDVAVAADASINPRAMAVDRRTGTLHFLDQQVVEGQLSLLLRVLEDGAVRTVRSLGPGTSDEVGLAVDGSGTVYYSQSGVGVRRITAAGSPGAPVAPSVATATGLAVDAAGSTAFLVDKGTYDRTDGRLYRVDLAAGGQVQTLRSDLDYPAAVALDPSGTRLFVAEQASGSVVELDPASGQPLQDVAGPPTLVGPTGLAVVTRSEEHADVYIQDGDGCAIHRVDRMPKKQVTTPSTPEQTTPTTPGDGDETRPLTTPTIPTGATGSETQAGADPADVGSGAQAGRPFAGSDAGAGFNAARPESAVGDAAGVGGAGPGGQGAASSAQPGAAGSVGPPPPASPAPGSGLAPSGHGAPGGGNVGVAGAGGEAPRGAARYTMVAHRRGPGPLAALAGAAIVGAFGCALILAARAESGRRARVAPARCRPKGAY